jgi:hypothetical protein
VRKIFNGGPAFPVGSDAVDNDLYGMTLRDYFAIHGDQPGQLEIASAAGVTLREHCGKKWDDPEALKLATWQEWFYSLPQSERYAQYARVRYATADAMLAERAK